MKGASRQQCLSLHYTRSTWTSPQQRSSDDLSHALVSSSQLQHPGREEGAGLWTASLAWARLGNKRPPGLQNGPRTALPSDHCPVVPTSPARSNCSGHTITGKASGTTKRLICRSQGMPRGPGTPGAALLRVLSSRLELILSSGSQKPCGKAGQREGAVHVHQPVSLLWTKQNPAS